VAASTAAIASLWSVTLTFQSSWFLALNSSPSLYYLLFLASFVLVSAKLILAVFKRSSLVALISLDVFNF